jgi:excisionase family DNA binding protein
MAHIISRAELKALFVGELAEKHKPILSPAGLAELLGLPVKTIYAWIAAGRLDGCFRKRGKHNLIWRDKALDQLFNGLNWDE